MIADQRFHLQSVLAKVDAMSMAHGLEVRVPLLDRRVMDLAGKSRRVTAESWPEGPPEYVLRKLAERLGMPRECRMSRKHGFNVPISRLLRRGDLRPIATGCSTMRLMFWLLPETGAGAAAMACASRGEQRQCFRAVADLDGGRSAWTGLAPPSAAPRVAVRGSGCMPDLKDQTIGISASNGPRSATIRDITVRRICLPICLGRCFHSTR